MHTHSNFINVVFKIGRATNTNSSELSTKSIVPRVKKEYDVECLKSAANIEYILKNRYDFLVCVTFYSPPPSSTQFPKYMIINTQ